MENLRAKTLFASENEFREYSSNYSTPFHLYDEQTIRKICKDFKECFSWAPGFTNYFAVKATPNPHILKILKEEGFGMDCSSLAELILSESVGFEGEEIFFTSNNTPLNEYKKAKDLGAILNLDDFSHIEFIHETIGLPEFICFRYNPGSLRTGNDILGDPKSAKFGLTKDQIVMAYLKCKSLGVQRFALHTMVLSNCLNEEEIAENAKMLFDLVAEIKDKIGVKIEMVNLGGGIGIPYHPKEKPFNIRLLSQKIQSLYKMYIEEPKLGPLRIVFECGRSITGPAGCIVTRVIHQKHTYKRFIGVDACMTNLMRPALYNAYHHITVIKDSNVRALKYLPKAISMNSSEQSLTICDVVGSLCENNDKFAVDRYFDQSVEIGDLLIIHDTGAHGFSMGFNYNGKLKSAEYLRNNLGKIKLIRRAETLQDYFSTLQDWKRDTWSFHWSQLSQTSWIMGFILSIILGVIMYLVYSM